MRDEAPRTLHFSGTPISLSAIIDDVGAAGAPVALRWAAEEKAPAAAEETHVAFAPVSEGNGVMRIHLPRSTPPGTYEAHVKIGDQERPVVIDVEPEVHFRIFPPRLLLCAGPNDVVRREVTIVNMGNVSIDVPRASGFGLFEIDGLERAVGEALQETDDPLSVMFDRARDMYAGLLRLQIEEGSGPLAPGESRAVRLALHLPQNIQPRRTYSGLWPLYHAKYYVQVEAAKTGAAT
jgi:hypothetical protein